MHVSLAHAFSAFIREASEQEVEFSRAKEPIMLKNLIRAIYPTLQNYEILSKIYGQFRSIQRWECVDAKYQPGTLAHISYNRLYPAAGFPRQSRL